MKTAFANRSLSLRTGLLLLCLTPFIGAFWAAWSPMKQASIEEKRVPSSLAFDEYLVNKHEISIARKSIVGRFSFVNRGAESIHIDAIRPSCGCVTVRLAKQTFAPGERGEFYLQVDTANEESGPKEYTAEIAYSGTAPSTSRVTFQMILPEKKLTVRPRALIFYHFNDDVSTQKLTLTDYRKADFTLTKVESSLPFVRPVLGGSKKDANGNPEASIHVTVTESVPLGRHQTNIIIHTTDPDYPRIEIPILIQRSEMPKSASKKMEKSPKRKIPKVASKN